MEKQIRHEKSNMSFVQVNCSKDLPPLELCFSVIFFESSLDVFEKKVNEQPTYTKE
ncbi:hypothetical protein [Phosphitispora fastidiosa]|uniref:hypothetical protein n=1 Tax=Phosphitispora fastidiosa TaxID=2837202 RepID=UPI001E44B06E|nr:hypothetical protein [Phosphitispora fastidiosa]MBU7006125.1 hypothetical protein [Phosphitispora fastidiosa]